MLKKTVILSIMLLWISSSLTMASNNRLNELEIQMIPYLKVLSQLSEELGVTHYVAEENKERFYDSVKSMTPREFAITMREQYKVAEQSTVQSEKFSGEDARSGFGPNPLPNSNGKIETIPLD
ncbi:MULTISPECIES: hypothetical protein [unclassified Rummeliibacillus]|uniref:hypothetical protein n=1 Tax=unclassified Rummeliibacillus TaxID=2622809 RepID=UPI000E660975|nr:MULTISPECIES: hypothetical protein [unclassified Rummeliibacillus]RIJ62848.1 hypothetical protein D1606_18050 [Rummeliibacillus sp. POC4]RPJ96320.1 hypothetical protein CW357_05315 [Rummeliibacillus sp. TYF005]